MRKKLAVVFTMFACAFACFMGHSTKTQAATVPTSYKQVAVESNKSTKVGGYYFTRNYSDLDGYTGMTVKKSANSKAYYKFNEYADDFFTNGKFVYFIKDYQTLCRFNLATKKLTKLKTFSDSCDLFNMYGGSAFVQSTKIDDTLTIQCYNVNKKTTKTIAKKAALVAVGNGKYIVFRDSKGKTYVRNCSTGKNTHISALDGSWENVGIHNGLVAFVKYDNAKKKNVIKTYNIATKKTRTVASFSPYVDDCYQGEFSADLSTYKYSVVDNNYTVLAKYSVNMKTGKITKR